MKIYFARNNNIAHFKALSFSILKRHTFIFILKRPTFCIYSSNLRSCSLAKRLPYVMSIFSSFLAQYIP